MNRFLQVIGFGGYALLSLCMGFGVAVQAQTVRFYEHYDYLRSCQQVRRYRSQTQLDSRELATLEYQYCVLDDPYYSSRYRRVEPVLIPIPSASASEDCINATILARLAIATDPDHRNTSEIAGFQQVLCALPHLEQNRSKTFEWQNGQNAKFGNAWYYPNGNTAKFGNTWYYPNGKTAKFGNTWYYPNGNTAKFGNNWYYPDGDRTELTSLLSWSCGVLTYFDCQTRLNDLQSSQGFWYDLTVIELSSRAYQEIYADYHEDEELNHDIDIDIIIK